MTSQDRELIVSQVGRRVDESSRRDAVDRLHEIAIAHALVRSLGDDRVEAIIAEAFADTDFRPIPLEVA